MNFLLYLMFIFCGLFVTGLTQLEEGSVCELEDGSPGVCTKLPECPPKLDDARKGRRTALSSRCGFAGFIEVFCCPASVQGKVNIRPVPADISCHDYENEILSGIDRLNWHIFGGIEAVAEEFPYIVALGYVDKTSSEVSNDESGRKIRKMSYLCGGTIIAPRFVLTAAHCVSNSNENVPILVRVGSVDLESKDEQTIPTKEVIAHPKYRRSAMYYDIALLKLFEHINWSKIVKPICLQTKSTSEIDFQIIGTYLVVVGWGVTNIDTDQSSKLLKTPSLQLEPRENCSLAYQGFRQLPYGLDERMICAKDPNTNRRADACQGYNGGPLLLSSSSGDTVLGVTSFGQSCGAPNAAVYTSVHSFIDWIESIVWPERVI